MLLILCFHVPKSKICDPSSRFGKKWQEIPLLIVLNLRCDVTSTICSGGGGGPTSSSSSGATVNQISERLSLRSGLVGGACQRDGGEGGRQLDVVGRNGEEGDGFFSVVSWQARLHQGLQGVDEELDVLRVAVGFREGAGESPKAAETATLKGDKTIFHEILGFL